MFDRNDRIKCVTFENKRVLMLFLHGKIIYGKPDKTQTIRPNKTLENLKFKLKLICKNKKAINNLTYK